jgi:pimeloyl-ACP methyl ester carboxylesterase
MSRLSKAMRIAGVAGTAVGVVAAGALAGALAERKVVGRKKIAGEVPFGSLRGQRVKVVADDGLELYAEVDPPDLSEPVHAIARGRSDKSGLTVVFAHGYALNLDCWHFQRADLRGEHRLVLFDQRSHGRSGRSREEHCTIDQLGRDLARVLDDLAPEGPVILVGHSMGGMSIMALADQRPELFGDRVVGVGLISTSAGDMDKVTLGLPGVPGRVIHRLAPAVVATLARAPRLVEGGRRAGSDIGFLLTQRLSFGAPVPDELVDFVDEMLSATPFEVVADFYPAFDLHDAYDTLKVLADVPTVIVSGTQDQITPFSHSARMSAKLPAAEFLQLEGVGHMSLLERPYEVSGALRRMIRRATAHA